MKKLFLISVSIVGFALFAGFVYVIYYIASGGPEERREQQRQLTENVEKKKEEKKEEKKKTFYYDQGMDEYETKDYLAALHYFRVSRDEKEEIEGIDSLIVLCEKLSIEQEKETERVNKEIEKLKNKYEKVCRNKYMFEVEQELHRLGFEMIKSGFEKAPDGSRQVKQVFEKRELGHLVKIELQPSYALGEHYYNVNIK
jgi:hypothetical protein